MYKTNPPSPPLSHCETLTGRHMGVGVGRGGGGGGGRRRSSSFLYFSDLKLSQLVWITERLYFSSVFIQYKRHGFTSASDDSGKIIIAGLWKDLYCTYLER